MQVVYFNKKKIKVIVLGAVILIAAIILFGHFAGSGKAPVVAEPIYQGADDKNLVAITVNVDWGEDVLPEMLSVLKEKDVKATFFITGRFAEKFPDLVKTIVADGHEIGSHGYSHPHHDQISTEDNLKDILMGESILQSLTGKKPLLFAPAYGEHGKTCLEAAEQNGNKVILWTADTIDWQNPPPDQATLVQRVTGDKLHNGTIILMHPKAHTVQALPQMIDAIREKGYTLSTVSYMLEQGAAKGEQANE